MTMTMNPKIKANHTMVYWVDGDNYSSLSALRSGGIIDAHYIIHGGGAAAPTDFVAACKVAGLSPILNNGNDGVPGWNGSDSYNANLAVAGWHAVGGESEQAPEIDSIMDHLIFLDYGGQGTGGGTNDDVWNVTHPNPVHGHGAAGYYETYDAGTNFWGWDVVGSGMLHAKAHGVREIGLLVGSWMQASKFRLSDGTLDHKKYADAIKSRSTPQDYIKLAQDMEAHGIQCAGIGVWGGYGTNMNGIYNQFKSWFDTWMAIWPPTNITMANRYGNSPVPSETVKITAPATATVGDHITVKGTAMYDTKPAPTTERMTIYAAPDKSSWVAQTEVPVTTTGAFSGTVSSTVVGAQFYMARNWEKNLPESNVISTKWVAPKAPTAINLAVDKNIVALNQPATFTATLTAAGKPIPNKQVALSHIIGNSTPRYHDATLVTDQSGQIKFAVKFASYYCQRQYTADFVGDDSNAPSTSAVVLVYVEHTL